MQSLMEERRTENVRVVVGADDPGETWDAFLVGHPAGHLTQSRAWACVKRDLGWTPYFLRLEEEGKICAAALILQRKVPGIWLSLLNMPRGPALDWGRSDITEVFSSALRQIAHDHCAFLVQTDPAASEDRADIHEGLTRMGFRREQKQGRFRILQPAHVMRIPVDRYGGPERLLAALPHKTRYNIKLAERKGVRVVPRTDHDAVRVFHRLLWDSGRRKGFPVRGFRFHETIWRHCVQAGFGEYLFAEHQGQILAAIQVLRFGPRAWYMYGASIAENRNLMAPYLLQWAGITRSWAFGCRCYDMRGVHSANPRPEDPDYGVYDFKRKFNAEMVNFLGEYDMVVRPRAYAAWRWLEQALQLPAGLAFRLLQKLQGWR